MMPRVLGIDINDINTDLVYYGEDVAYKYPTIMCKKNDNGDWAVGEEVYEELLNGKILAPDKLLTMTLKDNFVSIDGVKYYGKDLLQIYLSVLIEKTLKNGIHGYPEKIVISVPVLNASIVEKLTECMINLGYLRNNIMIISRAESFIYYILSKTKDIWNNRVALFELENQNYVYYEMKVQRLARSTIVYAESKRMEESINIELLSSEAGARLADKILTQSAEELIGKKVFSSVALTGKGFEKNSWAKDFLSFICNRRKVFFDADIFALGASIKAFELASDKPLFNVTCICDGRLDTSVDLNVERDNKPFAYSLVKAGDTWYNAKKELRLIPDNIDEIEFSLSAIESKRKKTVRLALDFLPPRPGKTRRIDLKAGFKDNRTMVIDISDAGFGDFYKKTDARLVKEVDLWD